MGVAKNLKVSSGQQHLHLHDYRCPKHPNKLLSGTKSQSLGLTLATLTLPRCHLLDALTWLWWLASFHSWGRLLRGSRRRPAPPTPWSRSWRCHLLWTRRPSVTRMTGNRWLSPLWIVKCFSHSSSPCFCRDLQPNKIVLIRFHNFTSTYWHDSFSLLHWQLGTN